MKDKTPVTCYIVCQVLVYGSLQPVFSDDNGLMLFNSHSDALKEIRSHVEDVKQAIADGYIERDDDEEIEDESDYEILLATVSNPWEKQCEQILFIEHDGDTYSMARGDDDWKRITLN